MENKTKHIVILGAGISGLTSAYWLKKNGFNITLLEAAPEVGGAMHTENHENFLVDYGPNSGLETTPLIRQIVEEVGLGDEMIYANEEGNTRYILKNGSLTALPMSPPAFFRTSLFSWKAKLRLFLEPFIGKSDDGYYQSISEFVERRLGREFLDYAIDPFVSGVFAGDPSKLSVKSAFPKLYRLEELYGGLIKGMIKGTRERKKRAEKSKQDAKMFSFKSGMQIFPRTIADHLGDVVKTGCLVNKVSKTESGYTVSFTESGDEKVIQADAVLSTIPSHKTAEILNEIDPGLEEHLNEIFYPPVKVVYLGYKKDDIGRPLDGFGFLIPSKENRKFLGAIWSSTIFTNRADDDYASFTMFVGGARKPELFEEPQEELEEEILGQFHTMMKIKGEPVFKTEKLWEKAIPQYNIGYIEHEQYFEGFEKNNPGLFLGGNYRGGISVGDCIKNSEINFNKIVEYLKEN